MYTVIFNATQKMMINMYNLNN